MGDLKLEEGMKSLLSKLEKVGATTSMQSRFSFLMAIGLPSVASNGVSLISCWSRLRFLSGDMLPLSSLLTNSFFAFWGGLGEYSFYLSALTGWFFLLEVPFY